jgi:hypothetical protein
LVPEPGVLCKRIDLCYPTEKPQVLDCGGSYRGPEPGVLCKRVDLCYPAEKPWVLEQRSLLPDARTRGFV